MRTPELFLFDDDQSVEDDQISEVSEVSLRACVCAAQRKSVCYMETKPRISVGELL